MNELQILRAASKEREKHWNPTGTKVPIGFRFTEFAGEAGEVANAGKKLMRHDMGLVGGTDDVTNLKEEIGDAIISLDLIAANYGFDIWECVVDKFNKTSAKHGFPITLTNSFFWKSCSLCADGKIIATDNDGDSVCETCRSHGD